MKILGLDASGSICSAAIFDGHKLIKRSKSKTVSHSEQMLPLIDECLSEAKLKLSDLEVCAFGKGPGSFTGLRLIASITQALAYSHQLKVLPISSMQAYAQAVLQLKNFSDVLVCEDARMNEVYWGHYKLQGNKMNLVNTEQCSLPSSLLNYYSSLTEKPAPIGAGWQAYEGLKNLSDRGENTCFEPLLLALGIIALSQSSIEFMDPEDALPTYLNKLNYTKS